MSQIATSPAGASMANRWRLLDGEETLAVMDSWDEVEKALLALPENVLTPNRIVDLVSPGGDVLSIGIAGTKDKDNPEMTDQVACLNFTGASMNPACLTVVGDPSLSFEIGGVVVFRFAGTWTEILRRNCVPVVVMVQVVKHFFLHGSLPDWIPWEEV